MMKSSITAGRIIIHARGRESITAFGSRKMKIAAGLRSGTGNDFERKTRAISE